MILVNNIEHIKLAGNELKKYRYKKKILNLLYKYHTMSATNICKRIGVSLPTALFILKELSAEKFVESRGTGESKGGRKPMMFGLKNDSILVVACELGRFKGKIGIYDSHNKLAAPVFEFATSIDDDDLSDKIYLHTQEILKNNGIDTNRIFGVGLAMPGLVDSVGGVNYTIKKKEFRNIQERLNAKFNKLIYVNNDARMQAYGEFIFGAAKGFKDAIIINWNWGLGMGLILNGKLYDGSTGFAGELSHTKFVDDGELCICGKRGCLETVTSLKVILTKARQAIQAGKVSQLTHKFKNRIEELQPEDIIGAAKSGDEFSISILNEIGLAFGKSLSNTIQLLNPAIIVLGGVVSRANQFVLTPIQQAINTHCLEQISGNTKIQISENWERSGLLGVTAMLYQKLFSDMSK